MPVFEIEHNGKRYQVDAPNVEALSQALSSLAPKEAPIDPVQPGDWQGVAGRLSEAEKRLVDTGPVMPDQIKAARLAEAQRQGGAFGQKNAGTLDTFGRQATNTIGLGLPQLLEAATSGFGTGLSTGETHEFIKAADDAAGKKNPYSDTAGALAGVAGQIATMPASGAASVGARIGMNAGQGAILGGLEGAITSRGDATAAAKGAAFGGVGGAVGTGIVEAVAPGVRKVASALAERSAKFAGEPEQQAAARVVAAAQKQGLDAGKVSQIVSDLGPDALLMDTLGPAGQRLGRLASNVNPEAQRVLYDASSARIGSAPERIVSAAERAAGVTERQTLEQVQAGILDKLQPQISKAYEAARNAGYDLPYTPFADLMQSPMVQGARKTAERSTKDRIVAFGDGQNSQLALWDATKRNIDAIAQKAQAYGDKGLYATASRLAQVLRETVDEAVPAYGGARDLRRAAYDAERAVNLGAEAATRPNMGLPQKIGELARPDETAKGFAAAIAERMAKVRGTPGVVDSIFGSKAAQDSARAALGPQADRFMKALDAERVFAATHRGMTGNSTTARQLADLGMVPAAAGAGYIGGYDPLQAGGLAALLVAGRRGVNKVLDARRAVSEEKVADAIAQILTKRALPATPARMADGPEKKIAEALIAMARAGAAPTAVQMSPR